MSIPCNGADWRLNNDPIEIKVSGFLVSLRRCEASLVEVTAK